MMFLAPLLAGLAALGSVPVIIWLLNRNRYKVVEWPALEFLLKTLQKSSKRLQLRELILLILRTLAVVLMALALARPTIASGGVNLLGMRGGVQAVFVLDNSLSMAVREGNESRLDQAKARIKELVAKLPRGSSAALVLMSEVAVPEIGEPSQDLAYVAKMVGEAQQSDGGTSIAAGLARASEILKGAPGRREIYLVTDMQEVGWPDPKDRAWTQVADELARPDAPVLFLADVGDGKAPANVQVERFAAADDIVTTEAPTAFTARLVNHGGVPVPDLAVELWTDGASGQDLRKAAATSVRLETVTEVRLEARLEPGIRRVQLRISPDRLPADDHRQLVVEALDKVKVLVVDGAEGARGGGSSFIKAALAPLALGRAGDPAEEAPGSDLFRVDIVTPAQFAGADLAAYQAVVINDVAAPPKGIGEALRAWLTGGRGLILMPGTRAVPASWNDVLAPVSPGVIGATARDLVDTAGAKGQGLETTRLVHPIVSFFASPETQPFLAQPRFWRAYPLTPGAGTSVVATFADGSPAMVERAVGRGAVLLTAFPSDKAWTDLPLRPAFLMLARRAVQHVALGNRPHLSVKVHEALRLDMPPRLVGARVEVLDPAGGRHLLNPSAGPDGSARVELADTGLAGFYQLKGADRPWWFAANPPEGESDLKALSREESVARIAPVQAVWIGSGEDAGARVDRARAGIEIWPFLFALAVACLIAESVLVVRWAPRDA